MAGPLDRLFYKWAKKRPILGSSYFTFCVYCALAVTILVTICVCVNTVVDNILQPSKARSLLDAMPTYALCLGAGCIVLLPFMPFAYRAAKREMEERERTEHGQDMDAQQKASDGAGKDRQTRK